MVSVLPAIGWLRRLSPNQSPAAKQLALPPALRDQTTMMDPQSARLAKSAASSIQVVSKHQESWMDSVVVAILV